MSRILSARHSPSLRPHSNAVRGQQYCTAAFADQESVFERARQTAFVFNEAQIPSCSSLLVSLCYDLVCCDSGSQKNKLSQGSAFLTWIFETRKNGRKHRTRVRPTASPSGGIM